jgi:peptidyl-prolyl cis-trans isomerase C
MKSKALFIIAAIVAVIITGCDTTAMEVKHDDTVLTPPDTASSDKAAQGSGMELSGAQTVTADELKKLDNGTIAIIGQYILTRDKYKVITEYMKQKFDYTLTPEQEKEFVQYIVNKKMMAMEARSMGYADKADIKTKYEWDFDDVLSHAYFTENIEKKSDVTEKEARVYYDAHIGDFVEIKAQHILVKSKQLADSLHKRIIDGESFDELAKKHSEDATTKEKGGSLGAFTKGVMVQEFEDAAFALSDGEVSQPVKSVFGYHIIKANERKKYSFDDSKDKIIKMIKEKKQQQVFEKAIADLKKKYKVTVNSDAVK